MALEGYVLRRIVRRKKNKAEKEIAYLFEKAFHLYEDGQYKDAIDSFAQVCEIVEQKFGERHPAYADSLNTLAAIYIDMGDYTKAEPLCQKALEIQGRVLGENHSDYADSLNTLAAIYIDMGDYTKAESLCQKALEIRQRDPYVHAKSWLGNRYDSFWDSGPKILGENHSDYADSLNTLAAIYIDMGNYTKAEPLCQKALEIRQEILGENHPDYADSLDNLAALYHKMGNYTKAEPLYQKALEIRRKVLGENHPDYADSLDSLATLYVAISRQSQALDLLRESVSAEDKVVDQVFSIASDRQRMSFIKQLQTTLHVFLSLVFQKLPQDQIAIQDALDLLMRRKSIAAEALNVQREIVLTGKYPQLKSTLLELNNIRKQIGQKSLAGPSRGEKLDKHKQYLEELNSKKEQLETKVVHQIPEIRIQQSLKTINSKSISNALPTGAALVEFVRYNNYNFNAIPSNGDLQWHSSRYLAFVLRPKNFKNFILRSKEPEDVQMIDLGDAESIDKMVALFRTALVGGYGRNLVALDTINYSSYRDLNRDNNNASWTDTGYELYNLIFHPLLSAIGDCKKLFIAPDGDLSRLPFEVLPKSKDSSGTNLLIDDYSITYLTTGRDILQINKVSEGLPNESIVVADPDFDLDSNRSSITSNIINKMPNWMSPMFSRGVAQSPSKEEHVTTTSISNRISRDFDRSTVIFNRLEGTKEEGQEISKLLDVQPLIGENVLESKLKSYRSPRILHIATHGFFLANQDPTKDKDGVLIAVKDRARSGVRGSNVLNRLSGQSLENPMLRSGLALAGSNTWIKYKPLRKEAEDGILTAEDVSMMDLTETELVVLSACETGIGEVHIGEGVFGLRRSFVLAGAKTLVMSLWKVPDEQTKELMIDFYKRLLAGKPRAEALREAQLSMKKKYLNPYYWGAFICQGNPGPLSHLAISKT
jgi:CHAT domain-containing protein/Tfp pilus assembly protein PilF